LQKALHQIADAGLFFGDNQNPGEQIRRAVIVATFDV